MLIVSWMLQFFTKSIAGVDKILSETIDDTL